jgi:protein ImuA
MSRAQAIAREIGSSHLWLGHQLATSAAQSTGFSILDNVLPGRGWPVGALTELIPSIEGIGELRLLLPALRTLNREQGRPIVFIRPPHIPYAPALARAGLSLSSVIRVETDDDEDARWAAEQTLREGVAGAVLLWSNTTADLPLRRLQLAAQEGQALAFLYRSPRCLNNSSPAAVRLALHPAPGAIRVKVIKARGGTQEANLLCPLQDAA